MLLSGFIAPALLAAVVGVDAKPKFTIYDYQTPESGPCDICTGQDGAIWTSNILAATIGRIDPKTGQVDEYDIPYTRPAGPLSLLPGALLPGALYKRTALACAIRKGQDGHIYASSGIRDQLVVIEPFSRSLKVITPKPGGPVGNLQPFNDLQSDSEGMFITSTMANTITHLNYKTGKSKVWQVPTKLSSPLGMRLAKDGGLWFAEFFGQKVGRLNKTTGEMQEYACGPKLLFPAVIRATRGKYLYFTAAVGNSIGRIDTTNGNLKAYEFPQLLSVPDVDTLDSQGNVWFSSFTRNSINKLDPRTGTFDTVTIPGGGAVGSRAPPFVSISVNYHPPSDSIFFSKVTTNQIGQYGPLTKMKKSRRGSETLSPEKLRELQDFLDVKERDRVPI